MTSLPAVVVRGFADPEIIEAWMTESDAEPLRVADDEVIFVLRMYETTSAAAFAAFRERLELRSDDVLIVDHSGAYVVLSLAGSFRAVLQSLCTLELPESGVVQAPIADVPCKFLVRSGDALLLAPSPFAHHVLERLAEVSDTLKGGRQGPLQEVGK